MTDSRHPRSRSRGRLTGRSVRSICRAPGLRPLHHLGSSEAEVACDVRLLDGASSVVAARLV